MTADKLLRTGGAKQLDTELVHVGYLVLEVMDKNGLWRAVHHLLVAALKAGYVSGKFLVGQLGEEHIAALLAVEFYAERRFLHANRNAIIR